MYRRGIILVFFSPLFEASKICDDFCSQSSVSNELFNDDTVFENRPTYKRSVKDSSKCEEEVSDVYERVQPVRTEICSLPK